MDFDTNKTVEQSRGFEFPEILEAHMRCDNVQLKELTSQLSAWQYQIKLHVEICETCLFHSGKNVCCPDYAKEFTRKELRSIIELFVDRSLNGAYQESMPSSPEELNIEATFYFGIITFLIYHRTFFMLNEESSKWIEEFFHSLLAQEHVEMDHFFAYVKQTSPYFHFVQWKLFQKTHLFISRMKTKQYKDFCSGNFVFLDRYTKKAVINAISKEVKRKKQEKLIAEELNLEDERDEMLQTPSPLPLQEEDNRALPIFKLEFEF